MPAAFLPVLLHRNDFSPLARCDDLDRRRAGIAEVKDNTTRPQHNAVVVDRVIGTVERDVAGVRGERRGPTGEQRPSWAISLRLYPTGTRPPGNAALWS